MNIETKTQVTSATITSNTTTSSAQKPEESSNFADELKSLSDVKETEEQTSDEKISEVSSEEKKTENIEQSESGEDVKTSEKTENKDNIDDNKDETQKDENINKPESLPADEGDNQKLNNVFDGLQNVFEEMNNKLNRTDENEQDFLKPIKPNADKNKNEQDSLKPIKPITDKNKNEADDLINNDMNIQEPKEQQFSAQMNLNMNFNTDGQPFADFMNNQENQKLGMSEKDLKEEREILSTMSENIAIANRNMLQAQMQENETEEALPKAKTVVNSEGIKKVDRKTNVTLETVAKFDNVVMDKSDVEFFTNLVEKGTAEATQQNVKSVQVSKTLADLLAKSMNENKPVRIDFDNNISVIIKVSRDGKISADFLPSSQVAEAYLKENLPLLRQRFDDNNIEYDELNQRKQKQDDKENRKKGQQDE